MRLTSLLVPILLVAVIAACSSAPPAPTPPPAPSSSAIGPSTSAAPPTPLSTVPATCPVTNPEAGLPLPSAFPSRDPGEIGSAWYGTAALWTMLAQDGEAWRGLSRDKVGYGQKTVWWSAAWRLAAEPQPALSVSGVQLDGPATFGTTGPATNATAEFGTAMLAGITVPSPGCWRITGHYRGATLSYVVWIDGA